MNKIYRNVIIIVSAIIGAIALTIAVLKILGIDTGIDCPLCNCKSSKQSKPSSVPQTKIKRHYTEIKLPKDD